MRSAGERYIATWLYTHNIEYVAEKRFNDCRDKMPLPFDFWVPALRLLIEYDGPQHVRPVRRWGGAAALQRQRRHDAIKNDYAQRCGYNLLRISHTDDIEARLIEAFTLIVE